MYVQAAQLAARRREIVNTCSFYGLNYGMVGPAGGYMKQYTPVQRRDNQEREAWRRCQIEQGKRFSFNRL